MSDPIARHWPSQALMTCVVEWCRESEFVTSYADAQAKAVAHHLETHPRRHAAAVRRAEVRP